MPSTAEMSSAIEIATRSALEQLFNTVPESFYYCALITTGEGLAPCLAAWSWEALERAVNQSESPAQARAWLQWSWGDSPYLAYGDAFFGPVKELFFKRDAMMRLCTDEESARELDVRLACMASALGNLDAQGLFGSDEQRSAILINAEVSPPDYTNTERALQLNPGGALLDDWLRDCAEPPPA
ncbi:DUF4303 domain-containing protein [Massilia violaceinigra]|uniref:DUF4303 domain-containing protein n=1 Tax=Massilia violaceinigra TaxID=2045208 RepID=A0ABY4A4B7_9BURK|nr:DUF4303 domain-containing protein [Massilia violaceinigra]UOD29628.1 DUF4303 domain-containing protein [Massilia violaceinigra]